MMYTGSQYREHILRKHVGEKGRDGCNTLFVVKSEVLSYARK